jgi:hypothetical protein
MLPNVAVVLIGYNRPDSLERLFYSVLSDEKSGDVDIIISIDKSDCQQEVISHVREFAKDVKNLKVIARERRLGLREHVLSCGDLVFDYDAIVMLEDDIVVSPNFLDYTFSAIAFTQCNDDIAGISLYSPLINEMALLPFSPKKNGYDNFYLQSAQSWGQCWTRKMWKGFRDWYEENDNGLEPELDMPSRIYSWPETSWKKYFMKYLVKSGKTFFYPHESYASNCAEVGQHNKAINSFFQVPLVEGKTNFVFGGLDCCPQYDIFFERAGLMFDGEPVDLDLYGTKMSIKSDLFLSIKKIDAPVLQSFSLSYRPQEENFLRKSPGSDIFLYDVSGFKDFPLKKVNKSLRLANFHANMDWRLAALYSVNRFFLGILKKIRG